MESIWLTPHLADEIIRSDDIFDQTQNVITDIVSDRITVTHLVENMGGILTHKEADNREKGMRFFTKILKELPKNYLNQMQVKFISRFYIDRLKDHHKVIPDVLEGYLAIIDMENYSISNCAEFLTVLFREVACQSQVRHDRYNIYLIIQRLMEKDLEYMKTLGPDFVYGFISAMDGERDPRNLMFLFGFLPHFTKNIPLGHLVEEMFEVISCYYPIDFHPAQDDPAAVSRQNLADALKPCLCASPEFAEQCFLLLIEKLDSSLRLAKIDSLKLLTESCNTFTSESYTPFLKTLWSSIHRDISHKTDDELKMAAHEALSALVSKLSTSANTDQTFENFVKGILIAMQTAVAEASTVAQFVQATKVLLTTANASKESCIIITKGMIPATIAYYDFKTSTKLQIASLDFLGHLYDLAKHWEVLDDIKTQTVEIPQLCLTAVSVPVKDYQVAGFKTLIRVKDVLNTDLVVPFIEVLIHNVQHSQDGDLLKVSIETVHAIARKYPELIMNLVVKGKCDLDNLIKDQDKAALQKRLNLLSNLASIDDFTKIIIEEMLKVITGNNEDANKVIEALSESMSNASLYSNKKVTEIESDHGLIDSVLTWLIKELELDKESSYTHCYLLISNTIGSLPMEKQEQIIIKHTKHILEQCSRSDTYFLVLESLYSSLHQNLYNQLFDTILQLALKLSLHSENEVVRMKSCAMIAHFLNKAEYGQRFELLYELLKSSLASCRKDNESICPKIILLYGWITKALIMRGHDQFQFWLQKITSTLSHPHYSKYGAEAIRLIMGDVPDSLTAKYHCRISLLYKQRMFLSFTKMSESITPAEETKEAYLLSWAYVLGKAPKNVLVTEVNKIYPIVIDSLDYDNTELLLVMIDVMDHFVQANHAFIADSLQTILPRLVKLSKYTESMDVRIKTLQCLYNIANCYRTSLLLPFKQDLLLDLAPSLDDKKRLVRNVAVKARTRWFLIGAPGEAKDN